MTYSIQVDNRNIFYHKTGNGPLNLVVIPGGPGLTYEYLENIHEILDKKHFNVYTIEPSGFFHSNANVLPNITAYAEEMEAILRELSLEQFTLMGHSWGGCVGIELLLRKNVNINKAILISSYSSGKQIRTSIVNRVNELPEAFHTKLKSNSNDLESLLAEYWIPKHVFRTGMNENSIASITNYSNSEIGPYYIGNSLFNIDGEILNWDVSNQIYTIDIPVLLMSGRYDYCTLEENKAFANKFPDGKLWYSEVSGHFPMHDEPKNFCEAVSEFIIAKS